MRAIEFLTEAQTVEELFNEVGLYRAVGPDEAKMILKQGFLIPSSDLMPFDWEVVEYSLGDDIHDMEEEEIEAAVQSIVPWYDGSLQSVHGGVNLTTDWDNARGYAGDTGVVFAVNCNGTDLAQFSDSHVFARDARGCVPVVGMYGSIEYSLEDIAKILGLK